MRMSLYPRISNRASSRTCSLPLMTNNVATLLQIIQVPLYIYGGLGDIVLGSAARQSSHRKFGPHYG